MRVRPKHREKSGGDCRVSKQKFRVLKKINGPIVRTGWNPRAERTDMGGPLAVGGQEHYKFFHLICLYILHNKIFFILFNSY